MKKKVLTFALTLILVLSLIACSSQNDSTEPPPLETETITEPSSIPETTIPEHEHEYQEIRTEPTCVEAGSIVYTCDCGETITEEILALGHDYITETIAPTYTEKGYDVNTCSVCGDTYQDNEKDVVPHEHNYKEKVTKPTCVDVGYTTYTCEICGHQYSDNKVNAMGHKYEKTTVAPTYTDKGYDIYKCTACTTSYKNNYVDVIPHDHEYEETVTAPSCTKKGYSTFTCKLCGHQYQGKETEMISHNYQEKVTAPTCEKTGYTTYTCTRCDNTKKINETPALGHNYVTETVAPTGKEKGYDLHTCSRCNDSYKDNYTDPVVTYTEVNETVYASSDVNIRKGPSTDYEKVGSLSKGDSITRIATGDNGWSKVMYNNEICYIHSDYLTKTKPAVAQSSSYPMTYSDATCTITIYKEWYKNAYVYAAHLEFTDYTRFGTDCANGKYNNGYETTSHAAKRLGAIFAVNGCYSSPNLDYTVVRGGKIWNGSGRERFWCPAVYSFHNGKFLSAWDSQGTPGISGGQVDQLVADGLVTDTFCFGPPSLVNGVVLGTNGGARAQRTFVGTNGNAGDIWVCVSDGRYNDGKSPGLTFYEAAEYLQTKGCTFGVHLDGGGSSTMYFNGKVLNAASGGQRSVVDFVYFK